jgi:hypothetical protein
MIGGCTAVPGSLLISFQVLALRATNAGGLPPGLAGCSFFLLFNQKKQISRKQIFKIGPPTDGSSIFL